MAKTDQYPVRLRPVIRDYLDDLAKLGPYGKGRAAVMRHFIETGIVRALEAGVLTKKDVRDHGEKLEENEADES